MKKLYTILAILGVAQLGFSQFTHTNYAAVDAYEVTGNFDSYNWSWIGADSQSVMIDVNFGTSDADLSTSTMGWKMSRNTSTGKVDYVIIPNSNITATAAGRVTFSVTNTSIPPDNLYLTELYAYQGANSNITRTLAQGMVDVRQSLYESDNLFTFPNTTGLLEYVRKDGDFSQFTGLGGTAGQVYVSDGDGTGTWTTDGGGDITAVVAGTGLTGFGTSGAVTGSLDSASIASLALADSALQTIVGLSNTGLVNDAGYGVGDFLADGSVPMTGDLNMGANVITNASKVRSSTYAIDLANGQLETAVGAFGDIAVIDWQNQTISKNNGDGTVNASIDWANKVLEGSITDPWELSSDTAPVSGNDIVDVEFADTRYINVSGDTMAGNLAMGGNDINAIGNATITNDLTMSGGDITFIMGKGIKWVTDSTNSVYLYGASPTSMVLRFTVDGVQSNTYFNL